ncbi:PREDICTED: probable G-protein coupled receptor No18 [Priapulus caudatus]|uniref:Probable G-protein coupled receptor No18 n=1 Tax=Priapulus caudatus TaxID=37621 RepID=A0ABM1EG77_PRICU|nr:PREDICTED: probable G-protein coupled receptor No18 [Priapulus caudatus]
MSANGTHQHAFIIPFDTRVELTPVTTTYFILILVTGLPSNTTVLLAYRGIQKVKRTELFGVVIVRALAISDICVCLNVLRHFFDMKNDVYLCQLEFVVQSVPLTFSVNILVAIAVERYLAICQPWFMIRKRHVIILIVGALTMSTIFSIVGALPHQVLSEDVCSIADASMLAMTVTGNFNAIYVVIMLLLIVLYSLVFRAIHRRQNNKVGTSVGAASLKTQSKTSVTLRQVTGEHDVPVGVPGIQSSREQSLLAL